MPQSNETALVLYAHDYTQGYGSFDFLPHHQRWVEEQLRPLAISQNSITEPFPFMRLPSDVRIRIYTILISSMFATLEPYFPKVSVAPRIRFTLRGLDWYPSEENNGDSNFTVTSRYLPDDPRNDPDYFLNLYKDLKDDTALRVQFNPSLGWSDFKNTEEEEEEYNGEMTDSDESDDDDEASEAEYASTGGPDRDSLPSLDSEDASLSSGEHSNSEEEYSTQKDEKEVDLDGDIKLSYCMEIEGTMKEVDKMVEKDVNKMVEEDIKTTKGVDGQGLEDEMLTIKADDVHVPERGFRLEIDCDQYSANDRPRRGFYNYEAVRRLTHVSRQFSQEIGACLWHNSVLQLEEPSIPVLFIKNRPAALQHVKGIILNLYYNGSGAGRCLNSSTPDLEELVNWMSRNLELRFLIINLRTQLCYITDFTTEGLVPEWERIFRSAKVMERFHIRLAFYQYSAPPSYVYSRYASRHALGAETDFKKNLEGVIRDLWMPDCLREEMKTGKASYIQSRLA
ncbi:hypothetical protein HYFRA_00000438 [Hymenoscyphus fraxineus]|uniref:Uncharacterized protein n=1 Tax=Hymenoscyphus fraxineus TaxID=746836 RepID=A0A9N9L4R9_9HELO|nr:hypothetical protein HYFRA_00000438 [Hymenoscyphus fraxineus]